MSNERQVEKKSVSTLEGIVCTDNGKHIAPVYKRVFDSKTNRNIVKKVDETNLFEFIQASKSITDLATLQRRFIELGEIPNVDPTLGSYDMTLMPTDIHGVYDMVNDLNHSFDLLPESVQKIFGSAEEYGKSVLDGTYAAKLNAGIKAGQEKPAEPVASEGGAE